MAYEDLEERLARLEALLDRVALPNVDAHRTTSGELNPLVLDRLATVTERIHRIAGEVERRAGSAEWDPADRLAVRLLLEHFTAAVRDCRVVAGAAADRLQRVEDTILAARRLASDPQS
jgi:hypothetical protein